MSRSTGGAVAWLVASAAAPLGAAAGDAPARPAGVTWAGALAQVGPLSASRAAADRALAAELLAVGMDGSHDLHAAALLVSLLNAECARNKHGRREEDISARVLLACEASLRQVVKKEAVDLLIRNARRGTSPRVRFHLARALGGVFGEEASRALGELAADPDPLVLLGTADGLSERADPSTLVASLALLRGKATPWEARLSVLRAVDRIGRPLDCFDALVDLLAALPADQGRLKMEIIRLLGRFCSIENPETDDAGWWRSTWSDIRHGRRPADEGNTFVQPARFFGVDTHSSRIVFLLDRTGSMKDPCTFLAPDRIATAGAGRKPAARSGPPAPRRDPKQEAAQAKAEDLARRFEAQAAGPAPRKIDGLKHEFARTILHLDPRVRFAVISYEANPAPWMQELVPATWENKLACLVELEKLAPAGGTNIWDALECGLQFAPLPRQPNVIAHDRKVSYATLLDGADTFFLMTDGNHNTGKFIMTDAVLLRRPDTDAFLNEIRKVRLLRRVTVHVVALGDLNVGIDPLTKESLEFLRQIAEETEGRFVHVGKEVPVGAAHQAGPALPPPPKAHPVVGGIGPSGGTIR